MSKPTAPKSFPFGPAAFGLACVLLSLHAMVFLVPDLLPPLAAHASRGAPFLLGGPVLLLAALATSIKSSRAAGAFLWLGAALLSAGLAVDAGPRLLWFFLGFFLWVAPQALAGTLFLLSARCPSSAPGRPRTRIPGG